MNKVIFFLSTLFLPLTTFASQRPGTCPGSCPGDTNPLYLLLAIPLIMVIIYIIDVMYRKRHPEKIKASGPGLKDTLILAVFSFFGILLNLIPNNYYIFGGIEEVFIFIPMILSVLYSIILINKGRFFKIVMFLIVSIGMLWVLGSIFGESIFLRNYSDMEIGLFLNFTILASIDYFFFSKKDSMTPEEILAYKEKSFWSKIFSKKILLLIIVILAIIGLAKVFTLFKKEHTDNYPDGDPCPPGYRAAGAYCIPID